MPELFSRYQPTSQLTQKHQLHASKQAAGQRCNGILPKHRNVEGSMQSVALSAPLKRLVDQLLQMAQSDICERPNFMAAV